MPLISIIMPTYNRADTIQRAIRSVQVQTFEDWELIVIDDGSQDQTAELIAGMDPRMVLLRQENQGVTAARNAGLQRATGRYFAFLDSDDEWLPHHLELSLAFFQAHPEEHLLSNELWEYFGNSHYVKHYQVEMSDWYPKLAQRISSHRLDLPPGEPDNYLRVYSSRQPVGEWGRHLVEGTPYQNVFHYRGHIYDHWRWGFLICLPSTMVTRELIERIGPFQGRYIIASDFGWMAECCRLYPANYLSIPACIKHELAAEETPLVEGHLAKGKTQHLVARDLLHYLEEMFWNEQPLDPELCALRSERLFFLGKTTLAHELRDDALGYFTAARKNSPNYLQVEACRWLVRMISQPQLCTQAWNTLTRAGYTMELLRSGEISVGTLANKAVRKITRH
jgi:glycosyltransferase involved in cell wall biosynthesis